MAAVEAGASRFEGILEQMNERLGNLERGQEDLRGEIRSNFRWMVGLLTGVWVTVLVTVLGALLTR